MYQAGRKDETSQPAGAGAAEARPRSRSSSWRPARCCSGRRGCRRRSQAPRRRTSGPPSARARLRGSWAACSSARTIGRRRSTTRFPRWCSTATSSRSTATAAISSPATSPNSSATATSSTTPSPPASSTPRSPSTTASRPATANAWRFALESLKTEPDFTLDETFEFDREQGALGQEHGRAGRDLAQARQERRAVADADRQDLARDARRAAEALRARGQAQRAGHVGRRVRELHERVRARVRPALELLLAAQLRGIPHPDEPVLRGHRRVAAGRGRLRHRDGDPARRLGAARAASSRPPTASLAVGQGKDGEIVDVVGWRLDDVVQLIRGPGGSSVRLQIQPGSAAPGRGRAQDRAAAQQDHARGPGREEGTARRSSAATRSCASA